MALTGEQRDLRDAVRGLLARHPGDDALLWQRLCREIGAAGLAIPERYGGAGAGPVETHIVLEELGRGLTASPMLGSAVLAAQALLASGDTAACQRLLPAIASGTTVAALAWTGEDGHWDPGEPACAATLGSASGWLLTGEAHYVFDGDTAGVLLAAAPRRPWTSPAGWPPSGWTGSPACPWATIPAERAAEPWPGPGTSRASRSVPSRWGRRSAPWS